MCDESHNALARRLMPATRGASGRSPKDESYGENLKAMDASDPAMGDLGTLASGSSDDALVIDPAAVSAAFADQLDDSVMRDALFTLGFDDIPPMSFTTSVDGDDGDGKDGKKARTTGSNQRAVQKRYRERKKQHTASLEAKVAELQSRIDELESEKREMSDLAANGTVPDRRPAQGGDESGIASTACVLVDAAAVGQDGRMSSACEKARKEYLLKFGEKVRHMRSALERGASDGELRQTLRGMLAHCLGKNPDLAPSGPALNSMMTSNARMLNREAAAAANVRGGGPVASHSGGSEGSDGFMAHHEFKAALMRSNEGIVRANNGAVCQSVCGGPLRVTIDGSTPSEEEASAHWITVAGAVRNNVPPSEITKLIRWRDEYVAGISDIYEERQRIGAKLAGVGQPFAKTGTRGDESPPSDESTRGDGTSPIVAETTQGEAFVDTIAVVEALRESVTRELELKMRSMPALVLETLSPRTSAAIIVSSYPFLPDAVAIASLMKTWRDDGNSVKV